MNPEPAPPRPDRPMAGIALYLVSTFFVVAMNAFVKKASPYHAPVEIVFYRGLVAMAMLLAWTAWKKRFHVFRTNRPLSHLGRSVAGNIGVTLVFWAYALMPMANTTALLFTTPLIVTVLSVLLLKEHVGPRRWAAVLVGFAGVALIAQPTAQFSALGIFIALLAACGNAAAAIYLRDLGRTEDALATVFWFLAFGIIFSGVYMLFRGHAPHPDALWPLLGAGVAGGLQLMIKTQAYRWAEASLLSPLSYTAISWSTLFGWMFWGDLPTAAVVLGTGIIIASNLFIVWRENKIKRP